MYFEGCWRLMSSIHRYGYGRELLGVLVQLVRDMDRKIERQKERAAKESEPRVLNTEELGRLDAIKVATSRPSLSLELPFSLVWLVMHCLLACRFVEGITPSLHASPDVALNT